jgi:hypothetical protein
LIQKLLTIFCLSLQLVTNAQYKTNQISGAVVSSLTGLKLPNINISFYKIINDSGYLKIEKCKTDIKGNFKVKLNNSISKDSIYIKITDSNYLNVFIGVNHFIIKNKLVIHLTEKTVELKTVTIKSNRNVEKVDTLDLLEIGENNNQSENIIDLLKNIKGISVLSGGKISYNGKIIKSVLIDGDDVLGNEYSTLLSSLKGKYVDKIQLIDSYNPNKILSNIGITNDGALNLKIKKEYQNSFRTIPSLSIGTSKKYVLTSTNFNLNPKYKIYTTLQKSNISINSIIQPDVEQISNNKLNEINYNIDPNIDILYKKNIYNSNTPSAYWNGNDFYNSSVNFLQKFNEKLKVNINYTNNKLSTKNSSANIIKTNYGSNNNWEIINSKNTFSKEYLQSLEIILNYETNKNLLQEIRLSKIDSKNQLSVDNIIRYNFDDSVKSNTVSEQDHYSFKYFITRKINSNSALTFKYSHVFSKQNIHSSFFLNDTIFNQYLAASKQESLIEQIFNLDNKKQHYLINYSKTLKNGNLIAEISNSAENNDVTNKYLARSLAKMMTQKTLNYHFNFNKKISNTYSLNLDSRVGAEKLTNNITSVDKFSYTFISNLNFKINISRLSRLNFEVIIRRYNLDLNRLIPDSIIVDFYEIYNSIQTYKPISDRTFSASYSLSRIQSKLTFLSYFKWKIGVLDYEKSITVYPKLKIETLQPIYGNNYINTGFEFTSFIFPINSTISVTSSLNNHKFNQIINDLTNKSETNQINTSVRFLPMLKIPLNIEIAYSQVLTNYNQYYAGEYLNRFFYNRDITVKCKYNLLKNIYFGFDSKFFKSSNTKYLKCWDIYTDFKTSKKFTFQVIINNIFNIQKISTFQNSQYVTFTETNYLLPRLFLFKLNTFL